MRSSERQHFYESMGETLVYKTGTANATAAEVVAAPGASKRLRVKAFRLVAAQDATGAAADIALNAIWLADGTTAKMAVAIQPGMPDTVTNTAYRYIDTGIVELPTKGWRLTANTALNIDFTATAALLTYQLNVWYDVVSA